LVWLNPKRLLGVGGAVAWPFAGEVQQRAIPVIANAARHRRRGELAQFAAPAEVWMWHFSVVSSLS
jgi:hypothetical protein